MAKISYNNQVNLYMDGMKVEGVTDIQFEGTKDSVIWEYNGGPSKTDPNVYLDFEYNYIKDYVNVECKYKGKLANYQISVEKLVESYNIKDFLNYVLKELLSYLMVPENSPIKLSTAYLETELHSKIKTWSMQFDTVSYNTQAITGSLKETTSQLSKQLPGVDAIVVCPACTVEDSPPWEKKLWYVIQHLNDQHRWSRESIADFLDELPDDIDITFKIPNNTSND